jgi:phospholipase C
MDQVGCARVRGGVCVGAVAVLILAACAGRPSVAPASSGMLALLPGALGSREAGPPRAHRNATTPIQHVVFIVQENRTPDNLFQGYPGADTVASGLNSKGQTIALQPIAMSKEPYDLDNAATGFFPAYDHGKMDGFDHVAIFGAHSGYPNPQYAYVPRSESEPYFDIASQYVLGDRMFASQLDASFTSHQYVVAGYASHAVNYPQGPWHCGGGPQNKIATLTQQRGYGPTIPACMDNPTLGDELDGAGLSWRYYAGALNTTGGLWSGYGAIRHIRFGPDWKNVKSPPGRFLVDIKNGTLSNVTWITPTWHNSDHASTQSATGPHWVTSLVNAIGRSKFWNTTAIFVMWDDWGGWYDHVKPPLVDYDGLGIRVPLLIISPYAKQGYVTHIQYEHGSILRFIEDNWGLKQLSASDARANDPATDAFNWTSPPRPFKPFAAKYPDSFFVNEADTQAPDSE